jgi:hypothetical protein
MSIKNKKLVIQLKDAKTHMKPGLMKINVQLFNNCFIEFSIK